VEISRNSKGDSDGYIPHGYSATMSPFGPLTPPQDTLQMVPAAAWAWTWTLLLLPLLLPAALGDNATLDQVPGSGGPGPPGV